MSADVICVDFKAKKRLTLEDMAVQVMNECFPSLFYESSLGFIDTAPSEYVVPEKEPA